MTKEGATHQVLVAELGRCIQKLIARHSLGIRVVTDNGLNLEHIFNPNNLREPLREFIERPVCQLYYEW
jgi:hypothetical protein